jgi:Retron-type reverse transcriptase
MNRVKTNKTLRHNEYYDMTATFDKLYAQSKEKQMFTNLIEIITSENNIKLAYRNIKKNKGSNTKGMDNKTIKHLEIISENEFIQNVQTRLQCYKPKAVRCVEIPKANGKKRPLGIPSIWDRIIQQCILQVLEPICEAKFHNNSYGFRPHRSAHHAIAHCYRLMNQSKLQFVVDIDIKSFFDNVNHSKLIKQMWTMGIRDKHLLGIIRAMLHAPIVLPNGTVEHPKKGTPQGGILSPLLSNIVLNELDWWIVSQWENMPTISKSAKVLDRTYEGKGIDKGNKYKQLRKSNLKEIYIVRYADDFKIFARTREDANKIFQATKQWLEKRLSLKINEEKSKIVNLKKKRSEFLGFEMKLRRKGNQHVVESHVTKKALERIYASLKKQLILFLCQSRQQNQQEVIRKYNSMVIGIHLYYCKATQVAQDFSKMKLLISRFTDIRIVAKRDGEIFNKYIQKAYGKSKQMRFFNNTPIVPIGFVQHKYAISLTGGTCKYTEQGRNLVHKSLEFNPTTLLKMMNSSIYETSIEYVDNRISKYSSQHGKCAITKKILEYDDIHCHHIIPKSLGGTDKYQNLIIIHKNIHVLIHATEKATVEKYLRKFNLDNSQLEKLNNLRLKIGLSVVIV